MKSKVYKAGDRVEIMKTKELGTVFITNGRWLNVKLDKGVTWKGEVCQVKMVKEDGK